jgi:hypothetical protein
MVLFDYLLLLLILYLTLNYYCCVSSPEKSLFLFFKL